MRALGEGCGHLPCLGRVWEGRIQAYGCFPQFAVNTGRNPGSRAQGSAVFFSRRGPGNLLNFPLPSRTTALVALVGLAWELALSPEPCFRSQEPFYCVGLYPGKCLRQSGPQFLHL